MNLLEAIQTEISRRQSLRIVPECAPMNELKRVTGLSDGDFREECRKLKREGKIEIKQTINSFSIYLK